MNIEKGQPYIVLETFKELGATLYENQTFEILSIADDRDSIRIDMIIKDVKARPKNGVSSNKWSLNSKIINKYCELITKPEEKEETEKVVIKVPIQRYNKKEFKIQLENTK